MSVIYVILYFSFFLSFLIFGSYTEQGRSSICIYLVESSTKVVRLKSLAYIQSRVYSVLGCTRTW